LLRNLGQTIRLKKGLAGKSPHTRPVELVSGTKLKDVAFRKDLYAKDAAALQAAHDPMIDLARLVDAPAREARKTYDAQEEIKNRRTQKSQKRVLLPKARAAIRMQLLHSVFPMEPSAATNRTENKFLRSPILQAYTSVLPSTTTNHRSICQNGGSTRKLA